MTNNVEQGFGPLQGLKVLDLSRLIAGNFLSYHLAEMGAEVLKIEDTRRWDPLRDFTCNDKDLTWKILSRNKKSVALNYTSSDKGREILLNMIRNAHVLIENFKPGGMEKFGLSPDYLLEINPKLVIVRISGWGQDGPYSSKPGFGTLVEALSGFAAKTGFPDSGPLLPNLGLADMITGITGAYTVLAAVRNIEVSGGEGQVIDLCLLDSIVSFLHADPATCRENGRAIPRLGNRGEVAAPRNLYVSSDGRYIALSASMQSMAERLFRAIGRADLIDNPKFLNNQLRVKNSDELDEIISTFIKGKTFAENIAFFDENGITAGPLYDAIEIMDDPHVKARGVYTEITDPVIGPMVVPGVAARLSKTPGGMHHRAPEHGEHTAEALRQLGIAEEELQLLQERGVVKCFS